MLQILVAVDGFNDEQKQRMRTTLVPVGKVRFGAEAQSDWRAALDGVDVVFGWPLPSALVQSSVRFHQLPSSGCDAYLAVATRFESSFVLATARGVCSRAVAEHCMATMFAFARRLPLHLRQQRDHIWQRASTYERLFGSTLCIAGMGAIGQTLAAMAGALGMHLAAVTRSGAPMPGIDETFPLANLHQALSIASHVAIALPALPGNRALMAAPEFAAMKQGSYLYSLGRGSHLDYAALREALHSGRLAGAGLDVFPEEPLPATDLLWNEPNVLISPHAGGRFCGENDDLIALFLQNALQFARGCPMQNVVIGPQARERQPGHASSV